MTKFNFGYVVLVEVLFADGIEWLGPQPNGATAPKPQTELCLNGILRVVCHFRRFFGKVSE